MSELNEPQVRQQIQRLLDQLGQVLAGKDAAVRKLLASMICGGHVLIEDLPGMGKTTLAQGLAASLGTDFGRIQFTAYLLPADIVGVNIYDQAKQGFVFHPGPLFHHIVLADEINRATPKAQSALLEAMAESQVSIEQQTHVLPEPFFVIATQNPLEHMGTFTLPESQLDRFFMRLSLGYPDRESERRVLLGEAGRVRLHELTSVISFDALQAARLAVDALPVSEPLLDYVLSLLEVSRNGVYLQQGVSPRAARELLLAAKAWAWLDGHDYVSAADVQAVWEDSLAHRVVAGGDVNAALQQVLEQVAVPA